MSLFLVDLVDMYWLSLVGELELAAAIGYAGSILFVTLSLCIGLSVGSAALLSQAVGRGDNERAACMFGNILVVIAISTTLVSIFCFSLIGQFLTWLGAEGRAHELASQYLSIVLPSMPLLAIAMASNGLLRSLGEPKQAMYLTLVGGFVNALLDPLFIFALNMGVEGAAVATVCSRVAMLVFAYLKIVGHFGFFTWPKIANLTGDFREFMKTAIPAVLTNLSTPIGVAYLTAVVAQFGDSAVAGNAIITKLQPLAFAGIFALSGAIGPIAGQNLGAMKVERIAEILQKSIYFIAVYCAVMCLILLALGDVFVALFNAKQDAENLILWFCYGLSTVFLFNGMTFVSNALFNNIREAHWATIFNFAKSTLFTMPFVSIGASYGGLLGAFVGLYLGSVVVGLLGVFVVYRKIMALKTDSYKVAGELV